MTKTSEEDEAKEVGLGCAEGLASVEFRLPNTELAHRECLSRRRATLEKDFPLWLVFRFLAHRCWKGLVYPSLYLIQRRSSLEDV